MKPSGSSLPRRRGCNRVTNSERARFKTRPSTGSSSASAFQDCLLPPSLLTPFCLANPAFNRSVESFRTCTSSAHPAPCPKSSPATQSPRPSRPNPHPPPAPYCDRITASAGTLRSSYRGSLTGCPGASEHSVHFIFVLNAPDTRADPRSDGSYIVRSKDSKDGKIPGRKFKLNATPGDRYLLQRYVEVATRA